MATLATLRKSLVNAKNKLYKTPLLKNLSWLMVAESLSRVSRIATLFVLAACFSNEDYGIAMLALLIHELFRVFTRLGTGAKIIQCEQNQLITTLENAATLQWLVALSIATLQITFAELIAQFYDMPVLSELLSLMALAHLFYPIVSIRIFEQQRQNQFRFFGLASGTCIAFENLLVAGLVLVDAGIFAVALAKVAAAIMWVALFYRLPSQLPRYSWNTGQQLALLKFSGATLSSELSRMLRFQSDSLIAARLLSPDQFGLYSFAKSAGLGIAQSVSQAYLSSLYPYLCEQTRQATKLAYQRARQTKTAVLITAGICTIFLVQSLSALLYVEWLFDERWKDATALTAILCLVAIPTLVVDHIGISYRARNEANVEMIMMLGSSLGLVAALLLIQPHTVMATALLVLGYSIVSCAALLAMNYLNANRPRLKTNLRTALG